MCVVKKNKLTFFVNKGFILKKGKETYIVLFLKTDLMLPFESNGNTQDTPLLTDFPDIEEGGILRHFDLYWLSLIKILSPQIFFRFRRK